MSKLVRCRVTGRLYDPPVEFIRILNSEPVRAQMIRMKNGHYAEVKGELDKMQKGKK
jgi:hypothetical protein